MKDIGEFMPEIPPEIRPVKLALAIEQAVVAGVIAVHPWFSQLPLRLVCQHAAKTYFSPK